MKTVDLSLTPEEVRLVLMYREPARIRTAASCAAPILSGAESSILAAYHAMDDEAQEAAVCMFRSLARDFPRAPRLRLIAGGAK